jgi:hypothetical protein
MMRSVDRRHRRAGLPSRVLAHFGPSVEVLDLSEGCRRRFYAAVKLMRKLLKKYASSPSDWSPTICDHTAPRSTSRGSGAATSAGDG